MEDVKLKFGINNVSNKNYHGDKSWLSSSSLKTLLKSPAQFHRELTEKKTEVENPNFTLGSLTHSMVLEPDQIPNEYAFFDGMRKQGKDFEQFKIDNPGKLIISKPQKSLALSYKRAFDINPAATGLLKVGEPEQSICVLIQGVQIKVRFDWINVAKGYGVDLKTSGYSVQKESFRMTMNQFGYGLSAALYTWAAEEYYQNPFDFYFACIAKQELDCQVFKCSQETLGRGRLEIVRALDIYKKCMDTGIWPESAATDKKLQDEEIQEI